MALPAAANDTVTLQDALSKKWAGPCRRWGNPTFDKNGVAQGNLGSILP